jgi:hypothetical protein
MSHYQDIPLWWNPEFAYQSYDTYCQGYLCHGYCTQPSQNCCSCSWCTHPSYQHDCVDVRKKDEEKPRKDVLKTCYKESVIQNLSTTNSLQYTHPFDISKNTSASFIVVNHSFSNTVEIQLEVSPDNSLYKVDVPIMTVNPNSFEILTPTRFIRYARIGYRSQVTDRPSSIDIYYQAQGC